LFASWTNAAILTSASSVEPDFGFFRRRKMPVTNRRPSPARVKQQVETFNARKPVGSPVRYWPVMKDRSRFRDTQTRSEAFVSESGHAVIFLDAIGGTLSLDHVGDIPVSASHDELRTSHA
jgi:hypothetical protein